MTEHNSCTRDHYDAHVKLQIEWAAARRRARHDPYPARRILEDRFSAMDKALHAGCAGCLKNPPPAAPGVPGA